MLGPDPSIHATSDALPWDVDPRVKPEDDVAGVVSGAETDRLFFRYANSTLAP
jgi:hypothetical protein